MLSSLDDVLPPTVDRLHVGVIDVPPHRWVGADLSTLEALLELQKLRPMLPITVYSPTAPTALPGPFSSLPVRPWHALPSPDAWTPADGWLSHAYQSPIFLRQTETVRLRGTPVVILVHSIHRGTADIVDRYRRLGAHVVANSYNVAHTLQLEQPTLSYIHPIIPTYFKPTAGPHDCITVVNTAALKGGEWVSALIARRSDWSWLIVAGGYGEQKAVARHLDVEYLPQLPRDRMPEKVYARASVVVSAGLKESYGCVAKEARACDVPVVTTATAGAMEALGFDDPGVTYVPVRPRLAALEAAIEMSLDLVPSV